MIKLIDKSALVAEIEKRKDIYKRHRLCSRKDECDEILSFINTLEVKEVDLDKEYIRNICLLYEKVYKEFWNEKDSLDDVYEEVLKRFKAQKGE